MNVIIFDFDGTIADTFDVVLNIINRLAIEFGYEPAKPEEIKYLQNLSSKEIIRQSKIPLAKLPFLLRRLKLELRNDIKSVQPIAKMPEVLQTLKQQGHYLAIVTSNSAQNVDYFLQKYNLTPLFSDVYTGVTLFGKARTMRKIVRQYQFAPERVVYVGDETRDIEAAKRLGIRVISVTWGYNSKQALLDHAPDFLIDHPHQLLDVAQQL